MVSNEAAYFKVGTIFNPIRCDTLPEVIGRRITIEFPGRLTAMVLDPSKLTENNSVKHTPGEVFFSTGLFLRLTVDLVAEPLVTVSANLQNRLPIIRHVCELMKQPLGYEGGFKIEVEDFHNLQNVGLGSTGTLQAGIAAAINHLFNSPIKASKMVRYLAQNYGKEVPGLPDELKPVQCIGSTALVGFSGGGGLVSAGENTIIASADLPEGLNILIGLPESPKSPLASLQNFVRTGNNFKNAIAYNILHYYIPALLDGNLRKMGDIIFDYHYNKGSILNCADTYPGLGQLMDSLSYLKLEGYVDIISLCGSGPAIFAIGEDLGECEKAFTANSLQLVKTTVHNGTYNVLKLD